MPTLQTDSKGKMKKTNKQTKKKQPKQKQTNKKRNKIKQKSKINCTITEHLYFLTYALVNIKNRYPRGTCVGYKLICTNGHEPMTIVWDATGIPHKNNCVRTGQECKHGRQGDNGSSLYYPITMVKSSSVLPLNLISIA